MRQNITNLLKTSTLRQSSVTLVGTFINGIVGVVFYILVARSLGPHDYGIFSFVTVTVALLASIANAGTDTGITKFVAKHYRDDKAKAFRFLKEGFLLKIVGWTIVLIIGFIFSRQIAHDLLKKDELLIPLRIALFGVGGSMLFSFGTAALQSLQRFYQWSVVNVAGNTVRLILFGALVLMGITSAQAGVWLFVLVPFAAFFLSLCFLPIFFTAKARREDLRELYHFNKWVAVTTIIVAVASRLDSLLTARYLTLSEVGFYAVAVSLSGFISQIVLALGTVAAPKLASFKNSKEAKKYFLKFETFVLVLAIVGIPSGILVAHFMVPLIYGSAFVASVIPLSILIVAYAIFMITMPINDTLLYFFSDSRFFVFVGFINLGITFLVGITLIPQMGMIGAAYSVLFSNIVGLFIPGIYLYKKFKWSEQKN